MWGFVLYLYVSMSPFREKIFQLLKICSSRCTQLGPIEHLALLGRLASHKMREVSSGPAEQARQIALRAEVCGLVTSALTLWLRSWVGADTAWGARLRPYALDARGHDEIDKLTPQKDLLLERRRVLVHRWTKNSWWLFSLALCRRRGRLQLVRWRKNSWWLFSLALCRRRGRLQLVDTTSLAQHCLDEVLVAVKQHIRACVRRGRRGASARLRAEVHDLHAALSHVRRAGRQRLAAGALAEVAAERLLCVSLPRRLLRPTCAAFEKHPPAKRTHW